MFGEGGNKDDEDAGVAAAEAFISGVLDKFDAARELRPVKEFWENALGDLSGMTGDASILTGASEDGLQFGVTEEQKNAALDWARAYYDEKQVMADEDFLIGQARHDATIEMDLELMQIRAGIAQRMYSQLGKYQETFVVRGAKMDRVLNAAIIHGASVTSKAVIDALVARSRVKAAENLADAFQLIGMHDYAGAAAMFKASALHLAVGGAAGLATALIDSRAQESEQEILGTGNDFGGFDSGGGGRRSRTTGGTARSVRAGPQVNNFNIQIVNHVAGDYNENAGDGTPADQIQALFDEGLVQIPA